MLYKVIIYKDDGDLETVFTANNDREAIRELKRLSWTFVGRAYFLEREGESNNHFSQIGGRMEDLIKSYQEHVENKKTILECTMAFVIGVLIPVVCTVIIKLLGGM